MVERVRSGDGESQVVAFERERERWGGSVEERRDESAVGEDKGTICP
jgi:hypothetical protein